MADTEQAADDSPLKIGIYGWRKRCLYFFIIVLVVIVIVNLSLTIWILSVMRFNTDGMGKLRINEDGIMMAEGGKAVFIGDMHANVIHSVSTDELEESQQGKLYLESEKQILLRGGKDGSMVDVNDIDVNIWTDRFVVLSSDGSRTFEVTEGKVTFFPGTVQTSGSAQLEEIETPRILSSESLQIESTNDMIVWSKNDANIEALTGAVNIQATQNIRLQSLSGNITLSASNIYLSGPIVEDVGPMEVCVCPSGKLFFAEASASIPCQESENQCS
jgi:hypothetical protein